MNKFWKELETTLSNSCLAKKKKKKKEHSSFALCFQLEETFSGGG